jgi:hypothetical protein
MEFTSRTCGDSRGGLLTKLLVVLATCAARPTAQAADFHSESRAVQINVAAMNQDGNPLTGLQRENFTVFDDSKPRRIQFFLEETDRPASEPSIAVLALASDLKLQNFTRNRALLIAAIDAFHPNLPPTRCASVFRSRSPPSKRPPAA